MVLSAQGIHATGFRHAQRNQYYAKFESHTNRVTFETNAIRMTSSIQALGGEKNKQKIGTFLETLGED